MSNPLFYVLMLASATITAFSQIILKKSANKKHKGITAEQEKIISTEYYDDGSGKIPRYYQRIAINKTIEAVLQGNNRILLVMATGTGKTYTAFQIIWRLWKSKQKKRILFLTSSKT